MLPRLVFCGCGAGHKIYQPARLLLPSAVRHSPTGESRNFSISSTTRLRHKHFSHHACVNKRLQLTARHNSHRLELLGFRNREICTTAPLQDSPPSGGKKSKRSKHEHKDLDIQTHYLGFYGPQIKISSDSVAADLVDMLKPEERVLLQKALLNAESSLTADNETANGADASADTVEPLTKEQVRALLIVNLLPFIGFGFLDNMIMIFAGEYIDITLGVMFGISTMAAAALGNIVSDLAGIGLAHYVEFVVARFGVRLPPLTPDQWDSPKARWTANIGKAVGLTFGCLIGMFPLFFFKSDKEKSEEEPKEDQKHKQDDTK